MSDFDDSQFDPLYSGLIVPLVLQCEQAGRPISYICFNAEQEAVKDFYKSKTSK